MTFSDWATLVGVVLPLMGIAGSAIAFVVKWFEESKQRRNQKLFDLMWSLDDPNRPIASKLAAAYGLREFSEHAAFVVRFCENMAPHGDANEALKSEFLLTAEYMREKLK